MPALQHQELLAGCQRHKNRSTGLKDGLRIPFWCGPKWNYSFCFVTVVTETGLLCIFPLSEVSRCQVMILMMYFRLFDRKVRESSIYSAVKMNKLPFDAIVMAKAQEIGAIL